MSIFDSLFKEKKEYIGLSSFKSQKDIVKKETKDKSDKKSVEKTALTGMLKRVG